MKFSNDREYVPNFLDMNVGMKFSQQHKNQLKLNLLAKLRSSTKEGITDAELKIHRLRAYIVFIMFGATIEEQFEILKLGFFLCKDTVTDKEWSIFEAFSGTLLSLWHGDLDEAIKRFTQSDKRFGLYRHERWLKITS